ncbi:MAG: T9SS type A sorting domain-containing protein, partial [Chitinophagales bacterium]|nr:T9SS type A sorting domain-containing protein [Chitinophagales bacterium]
TLVDMVFGLCAGIVFEPGSTIRANNSVFRSCFTNKSWRGFEFEAGSGGIIEESVFKNAHFALLFRGGADALVINNLFYNCKVGVASDKGNFREPITGNTFIVESTVIPYTCYNLLGAQNWGIVGHQSNFLASVSHNDFINPVDVGNTKQFIGVYLITSSGTFSENKFTNLYRCFDMQRANNSEIDNNEIELSQQFTTQSQIRGANCTNISVLSNEIEDTYEYLSIQANSGAIWFSGGSGISIKENRIEGFSNGIILKNTGSAEIIENSIMNCNHYGIYLSDAMGTDVSCNTINMHNRDNTFDETGIFHYQSTAGFSLNPTVYRNNCILETDVAMYLSTFPFPLGTLGNNVPQTVNNFLYNYTNCGIQVVNFEGNIGSSILTNFSTQGRNTFVSNNGPGGAVDIHSTYTIDESGNFGVNVTSNVNSFGIQNKYHSTASCANQVEENLLGATPNSDQEITDIERCDFALVGMKATISNHEQEHILKTKFVQIIQRVNQEDKLNFLLDLLTTLSSNQTTAEIEKLNVAVNTYDMLYSEDLKWFEYYYALAIDDYLLAGFHLGQLPLRNQNEKDLKFIESLMLDLKTNKKDLFNIDEFTREQLHEIDIQRLEHASLARDLLNLFEGDLDYIFGDLMEKQDVNVESSDILVLDSDLLEVFPNPSTDKVFIKYFVKDGENTTFRLFDMSGKLINDFKWTYSASKVELSLNSLNQGVYLFVIQEETGNIRRAKIVKR